MTDYLDLFKQLMFAETEDGVEDILRECGYLTDNLDVWLPFGGTENNFATIGNQQSDATGALVEKMINSIDAMLMAACYQRGIDPKGPEAPQSMAEATARFFRVRDGHLGRLSREELRALAEEIQIVAVGGKKNPCYLIVDKGEGQTPAMFPQTFLSLMRTNKIDIPFVQGKFNAGGTGVLQFCGQKNYQLIVSRRHPGCPTHQDDQTRDLWGFTLVRRLLPSGGRRSSMYVYLAPGGRVPSFRADTISVLPGKSAGINKPDASYVADLPYGTCIKLYNYRWRGSGMATLDGRYDLEQFLLSCCLPFRITETREYRANYYSATVTGGWNRATAETDEGESRHLEDGFPAYGELNLGEIGVLPYQMAVFTKPIKKERFPHGICFVINGQVHGSFSPEFVKSRLKFDYLTDKYGALLVLVDCTAMNEKVREDFFMASRDRFRRNEVYREIEHTLIDELQNHPGLQTLNQQRRKAEVEQQQSEEGPAEVFQQLLKADPTLAAVFSPGDRLSTTTGPNPSPTPFVGRKFPNFFRLKSPKEGGTKGCPLNRTCRVEFETDVVNDYFKRADSPGNIVIDPPNLIEGGSHLWNGRFEAHFRVPWDAEVGTLIPVTVSVSDVMHPNPFVCHFQLRADPEVMEDQPSGSSSRSAQRPSPNGRTSRVVLSTPKFREVRKSEWEKYSPPFTPYESIRIKNDGQGGYDYLVNIDSAFLVRELKQPKENEGQPVKLWFIWGLILAAMGMLNHDQRLVRERAKLGKQDDDLTPSEEGDRDLLEQVNLACNGLAETLIPVTRLYRNLRENSE
ncbi:hypothetical protein KSF_016010 [Reticulibacter mediterranei]|uniref:Uncharacterized protein n=1 Tax=Reticulibacter mediterranei TaxID=2778369 RepID=A0A8J3N0J3_9CHLR|nr:hypothetical protein [Reticulibacter mediterranei]GHO91553.1 hypothetical protein KSF_016010 [Reticulibacter mediterranei]